MKIKEYINRIVENGDNSQMEELSDMLVDLIYDLKSYDEKCYMKYKNILKGLAYDYKIDKEMAEEIVSNMEPLGEFWDMATTNEVKNRYGLKVRDEDFYVVINSMVNDYGNIIDKNQVDTYTKLATAFINDEDGVENKVWKYYTTIVK